VWATADEGQTWRNLTANLPTLVGQVRTIELVHAAAGKTALVVGGLGGVFQLPQPGTPGAAWSRLGSNLPHGLVLDLRYNEKARVLIAGVLGRGAWTLTGYFSGYAAGDGGQAVWESAAAATAGAGPATPMALPSIARKTAPHARAGAGKAVVPVN
jgi:hypothetical protein